MAAAAVPLAIGMTGYSIFSGERARKDAKREIADTKAKSDAQNAEYLARQEQDQRKKSAISMGLRRSLLKSSSSANIFNSQLGTGDKKSLLGT